MGGILNIFDAPKRFGLYALIAITLPLVGCKTLLTKSPETNGDLTKPNNQMAGKPVPVETAEAVTQQAPASSSTTKNPATEVIETPVAQKPIDRSLWSYMVKHQDLTFHQHARIKKFENYFLKHKRLVTQKTKRAAPYLYYIVQELEKRNMPIELAFTPMVESNFDPLAHSVVQAAGLWQFMPATGKRFGLDINQWYDGRRDVVASTEAALNYYQYLNKMFNGDWLLTVAAYNVGEGNVLKAMKKNRKLGKPTNYWALKLPKETMRHVPKWLALSNILINHKNYRLNVAKIENTPTFASVSIKAPANLAQLADYTGLDKKVFYRLNPAFNKLLIPASHKKANLLVPIQQLAEFEYRVQNAPKNNFKVSFSYQVKSGDNLSTIAHKHQTNVKEIKRLNNLNNNLLKIGQVLKLPGGVAMTAQEQQFFSSLNKNKQRRRYKIYKVRSGDSLWSIARKFKISTRKLASWNKLSTKKVLRIGQKLKVWPSS